MLSLFPPRASSDAAEYPVACVQGSRYVSAHPPQCSRTCEQCSGQMSDYPRRVSHITQHSRTRRRFFPYFQHSPAVTQLTNCPRTLPVPSFVRPPHTAAHVSDSFPATRRTPPLQKRPRVSLHTIFTAGLAPQKKSASGCANFSRRISHITQHSRTCEQ